MRLTNRRQKSLAKNFQSTLIVEKAKSNINYLNRLISANNVDSKVKISQKRKQSQLGNHKQVGTEFSNGFLKAKSKNICNEIGTVSVDLQTVPMDLAKESVVWKVQRSSIQETIKGKFIYEFRL